jgi:hypothetical protein
MSQRIKTDMKFHEDKTIEGTFVLPDTTTTKFYIDSDGNWHQWGNSDDNLKKTIKELTKLIQLFYYTDL